MAEKYYPEPVPFTDDLPYIREYLGREFSRIYAGFLGITEIELEELSIEPTGPRAGMLKFADGTNWDPGEGKGLYFYDGTDWLKISPLYKTGVWTPTIEFGGGSTGVTYASQRGNYTRIGNLVHIDFELDLSAKGTSTGTANISGLPYSNAAIRPAVITASYWENMNIPGTGTLLIMGYADDGDFGLRLRHSNTASTGSLTEAHLTDTTRIIGGGTYRALD